MDTTPGDPVTDLMSALDIFSTAVGDDPRLPQVLTEAFASIDAGDHDNAAQLVREFLRGAGATAAEAHPSVLTDGVMDDAARILVEDFVRGSAGRSTRHDNRRTAGDASGGFGFLNPEADPALRTP